jgi:putative chitinase
MNVLGLIAAGILPTQAKLFVDLLNVACSMYCIDTPLRQAAFVSQCAHESLGFGRLEESFYYRDPRHIATVFRSRFQTTADAIGFVREPRKLADHVYCDRYGNGDEASGEGWKYRGRGLLMVTFKDEYKAFAAALLQPYVQHPEMLSCPKDACISAAWFWKTRGCNELADSSAIDAITRKINPAMLGADARRQLFQDTLLAFLTHPDTP